MCKYVLYSVNIGNPSIERAKSQVSFLRSLDFDILILTETKLSVGCDYIYYSFLDSGYNVIHNIKNKNSLGTMIISKNELKNIDLNSVDSSNDLINSRMIITNVLLTKDTTINICGVYVPSRDRTNIKIARKQEFIKGFKSNIKLYNVDIISGDFNIIPRSHIPKYNTFYQWEYDFYDSITKSYYDVHTLVQGKNLGHTWIGRTGNGYRYDYCFINKKAKIKVQSFNYDNSLRHMHLTDHKGIKIKFSIQ